MTSTRVARWHLSDLPLMSFWAHKLCSWAHQLNMQNNTAKRTFLLERKSNCLQSKCPGGVARSPLVRSSLIILTHLNIPLDASCFWPFLTHEYIRDILLWSYDPPPPAKSSFSISTPNFFVSFSLWPKIIGHFFPSTATHFVGIYLSALLLFSNSLLWHCSIVPPLLWLSSIRPISYKLIMVRQHTKSWVAVE